MTISEAEQAKRAVRFEVMKRTLILVTATLVTICLVVVIILLVQSRERGRENHELLTTIRSCTEPTGTCYQSGQKRTASAVADINRVVILAAACATGLPEGLTVSERQTAIQSCVITRLASSNSKP